jgi:hypothetical protein
VTEIPIAISEGIYFVRIYRDNDREVLETNEVSVSDLDQSRFNIPSTVAICQSYELLPEIVKR